MQNHTITTYSFSELSEEAKQKAIENGRISEIEVCDEWYEFVYEDFTNKLEKLGYIDPQFQFSGFWSQGDGASFTCEVDLETWIKGKDKYKHLSAYISDGLVEATITRLTHQYSHKNTCTAEITYLLAVLTPEEEELINELEAELEAERLQLCEDLYADLEKEYEHFISDESIVESLEANEVEFLEDGTVY